MSAQLSTREGDKSATGRLYRTDTHWRCEDRPNIGANFNYRIVIPISIPHAHGCERLNLGLWDKELVGDDNLLAEAQMDLKKVFKQRQPGLPKRRRDQQGRGLAQADSTKTVETNETVHTMHALVRF